MEQQDSTARLQEEQPHGEQTRKAPSGGARSEAKRRRVPELLAPAGNPECLAAALAAGADAVYFGLTSLNARQRARNFHPHELGDTVQRIHDHRARAYLTLNTDLTDRELGQALRMVALAQRAGVDAILIRDPALLAVAALVPEVEFHFSTQAAASCRADVEMAKALGIRRVVLAREMTLEEIRAASAVEGVETEVFVQGALCYSISGRCLLSSWLGGRSGNRGACASPCRLPWSQEGNPAGGATTRGDGQHPLSMHDLALLERLPDLAAAGVACLKIEGRLKTAAWVGEAVGLYREALRRLADATGHPHPHPHPHPLPHPLPHAHAPAPDPARGPNSDPGSGGAPEPRSRLAALARYTGRRLTDAYLDGARDDLTGTAGRDAGEALDAQGAQRAPEPEGGAALAAPPGDAPTDGALEPTEKATAEATAEAVFTTPAPGTYNLRIAMGDKGLDCQCRVGTTGVDWRLPRSVVKRPKKAMTLGALADYLLTTPIKGLRCGRCAIFDPDFLIPPRTANHMSERISAAIHKATKAPDTTIRLDLPPPLEALLATPPADTLAHPENRRGLAGRPDRCRVSRGQLAAMRGASDGSPSLIVEQAGARDLPRLAEIGAALALPWALFEEDARGTGAYRDLCAACADLGIPVEVNTWGGLHLARAAQARVWAGPGLGVLNRLAAQRLRELGCEEVHAALEASAEILADLSSPAPLSVLVYGRPPLLISRVAVAEEAVDRPLTEPRGERIVARREGRLTVYRPTAPMDWSDQETAGVAVAHTVADLVGDPDPLGTWRGLGRKGSPAAGNAKDGGKRKRFNLLRGLR